MAAEKVQAKKPNWRQSEGKKKRDDAGTLRPLATQPLRELSEIHTQSEAPIDSEYYVLAVDAI